MAAKITRSKLFVSILLILVIAIGGFLAFGLHDKAKKLDHPEYLSFPGNYVFTIPKDRVVDEQAINGIALVYSGSVADKSIDQIYADNGISLQPITNLKDHKGETFKKYVTDTFVPDAKKVLSPDINTKFVKVDGWDVAKVTVTKAGQPLRFIYLKNGQHPLSIVSKEETDAFKKIEQSITDFEKTDLKKEGGSIKQTIQTTAQQIKDQKASALYAASTPQLHSGVTESNFTSALKAVEVYTQGTVTINGGSYANNEFDAVINFVPLNKDFKPASGVIFLQKINGQWKLNNLTLPNPSANKVQQ